MNQATLRLPDGYGFIEVDGLKLWYTVQGQGPVCLVPSPGWGLGSDLYQRTLRTLCADMTLVFIDSRGCGRSQAPPSTNDYRYSDFAMDLEGIRRELRLPKVWVLGHSHAGVIAMRYAADYPDGAAGLILIGTLAETDADYGADVERRKKLRAHEPWYKNVDWDAIKTAQELSEGLRTALPLYFHDFAKMTAALEDIGPLDCMIHPYHGWRDSEKFGVHELEQLPKIKCPTLLIAGEDDFVGSPMNSRRIVERVAGSEMAVIARCGHFPWIEQPKPFYSIVGDFLGRRMGRSER